MARILAIDYGTKRVGLAVTDPMQMIASGLTTVKSTEAFDFIKKYCEEERVESIVIGEPKTLDNKPAELELQIGQFVNRIKKWSPKMPVYRVDERFTSSLAMQSLIDGGVKKKQRRKKELLDEVSATIILQSYLESIQ
ncbi:MAG: Holliday junction resolvase RuvX [Crocinitomicaceae bacterium]|nr:Holliday junction resolvase RuvX [Crocinitomicaceae bacterium]|tara:strand:+ start:8432 stop:8845 length:414 start_codon:yes stop_codon:yes gene_type:complete